MPTDDEKKKIVSQLIPRGEGKQICIETKNMRKALADANGIDYEIKECHFEGLCAGTCQMCDKELLILKQELEKIPMEKRVYPGFTISKKRKQTVNNIELKEFIAYIENDEDANWGLMGDISIPWK